jgi:hypothetical protein
MDALVSHLWLSGGKYPDWIADDVFTLRCCEMYGCVPSALDNEDWHVVQRHRVILQAEQKYREADAKAKAKLRGKRGR